MPTSEPPARPGSALGLAADWRPQPFGRAGHRKVGDPIVEPLWAGIRCLVLVEGDAVTIRPVTGDDLEAEHPQVARAIAEAVLADAVVLDGYLTQVATRDTVGVRTGANTDPPSFGRMTRQMLVGGGGRDREAELREANQARLEAGLTGEGPVAFVAVDLLLLDRDAILDIPLLERKRQLESVVEEGLFVRHGAFVRPPIDSWLAQWRAFGFREVAFKGANSRYTPGRPNDAWATIPIPRR